MFRSWKIGRLAGVDLYVHSTFVWLMGFIALTGLAYGDGLRFSLHLILPLMLFGIVILHELGHALAARHYKIGTRDITLYPIGGIARLDGMPSRPRHEMVVAAAGPAVNFVLAGAAWLVAPALAGWPISQFLLSQFLTFNLGLGLFNLLPAFPMDGGRILRAFLAGRGDFYSATRTAATLGKRMAWALGIIGLLTGSLNLVLLSVFVWISASAELAQATLGQFASNFQRRGPFVHFAPLPRDPRVIDAEYWEVRR